MVKSATIKSAAKAVTPAAPAAKGKAASPPPSGKKAAGAAALPTLFLAAGAISKDVGPAVLASLAAAQKDEERAHELLGSVDSKRYDALSQMTRALVLAIDNDPHINIEDAFSTEKKRVERIYEQCRVALGIKVPRKIEIGGVETIISEYAPAVAKLFPSKADKPGSDTHKRKDTLRSNFTHALKKCLGAAIGILDMNADMEVDKDTGTLLLTGPAVKVAFGSETVTLDGRQSVGEGESVVKLNMKPSYEGVAKIAQQKRGAVASPRKAGVSTAGAGPVQPVNSDEAFGSLCNSLIAALNKMQGRPSEDAVKAMLSVESAINAKLDTGTEEQEPAPAPAAKAPAKKTK